MLPTRIQFSECQIKHVSMRIKPTSAYQMCEFIIYVENLLHVSATFCGHLQGGVVRRICYKEVKLMNKYEV